MRYFCKPPIASHCGACNNMDMIIERSILLAFIASAAAFGLGMAVDHYGERPLANWALTLHPDYLTISDCEIRGAMITNNLVTVDRAQGNYVEAPK